jgi:hypothetical protein
MWPAPDPISIIPVDAKSKCTNPHLKHPAGHSDDISSPALTSHPPVCARQNSKQISFTQPNPDHRTISLCLRSQLQTSPPERPHGRRHVYFATPFTKSRNIYFLYDPSSSFNLRSAAATIELTFARFTAKHVHFCSHNVRASWPNL